MSAQREDTLQSKKMLTELIEQHARIHLLAFIQAGKIICKDPRNRNLIAEALGGWSKGRVPNDRTMQRWKDADNAFMALRRPGVDMEGLTQDQLEYRLAL